MPSPSDAVPGPVSETVSEPEQGHRPTSHPSLSTWLEARVTRFAAAWVDEVRRRAHGQPLAPAGVVERFLLRLVAMVPHLVGPRRELVRPLWEEACELFGTTAAKRGLAAGEVAEELHVLREIVIRELYRDPPTSRAAVSLREVLRLNRVLDRGVTYATVGYTDAMFYQYLEGGEKVAPSLDSVAREVAARLDSLDEQLRSLTRERTAGGEPGAPN